MIYVGENVQVIKVDSRETDSEKFKHFINPFKVHGLIGALLRSCVKSCKKKHRFKQH